MRAFRFWVILLVLVATLPALGDCVAKQESGGDPGHMRYTVAGTVEAKHRFVCRLADSLNFQLVPVAEGWEIAVNWEGTDADFVFSQNAAREKAALIPYAKETERSTLNRDFYVRLTFQENLKALGGSPNGSFVVTQEKRSGESQLEEISFEAAITLPVSNGSPVFYVGGGVSPPQTLSTPDPHYPRGARKQGKSGTVILWCVVNTAGRAESIKVARPLGDGFDEEAIKAVSKWKFKPAAIQGHPVPVTINIEVNFR